MEFLKKQLPINSRSEGVIDGNNQLNVLSLFSGCGGMDLGFEGGFDVLRKGVPEDAGYIDRVIDDNWVQLKTTRFRTLFSNDILKDACTAWGNYFTRFGYDASVYRNESIVDLVKAHRLDGGVFPGGIDVVTGGFPCQDFSVAGKRKGFNSHKNHHGEAATDQMTNDETRGKLYFWMKEVIEITKPKIFIAENVKGLVNLSNVKEIIQQDFSSADGDGYLVLPPKVLHAANYGVPQSRERVIFIGIRKSALRKDALEALSKQVIPDEFDPYPKPTHAYTSKDNTLKPAVSLCDVFSQLVEPACSEDPSQQYYSKAKYMGTHCQGQTEIDLSKIGPTIRSEHHGNIEFRRLSSEHGGTMVEELAQGLRERRLTPRECALIQTFPPDYQFVVHGGRRKNSFQLSPTGAYKVIGNAVPPLLAYNIAKRIEAMWNLYFECALRKTYE